MKGFKVKNFTADLFGGWQVFSEYMHRYYVESSWNFGYKCPKCDKDDYDFINNKKEKGKCPVCDSELVSFFHPERTEKYFNRMFFMGRVILHEDKPVGWILGFKENLKDFNDSFPSRDVYNLSYICILPEFRKTSKGVLESFRRVVGSLKFKGLIPNSFANGVFRLIGKSPIMELFEVLMTDAKNLGYVSISTKVRGGTVGLEKLARAAGFYRMGFWQKDPAKFVWVKDLR